METITEIIVKENYNVIIKFADGFVSEINLKKFINGGISDKLLDYNFFKKVEIDEFGGLCWPNGYDICPNYLRELIENNELQAVS